ncbi:hypothetical protein ES703_109695 [subsurface metagenome]
MKILQLFGVLTLAVTLLVGSAGSVSAQESAEVTGVIIDVNPAEETITIAPKGGGTEITLKLTGIEIMRDEVIVGIDALSEGDRVEAIYNPETNQALSITAESPPRGSFGITDNVSIGAEGEGSFTLETKWGTIEVFVTDNTTYHIPTYVPPWQTWEELGELVLEGGDRVAILFTEPAADHIAQRIMVLPHSPLNNHTAGIIIEVTNNTITIENNEGNIFTFDLPEDFPEAKVGELVTVISKRLRGIMNPVAKASVNVERISERLNRQMENIARRVAKGEIDEEGGNKDIEHLRGLLEANYERHCTVLERVSTRFEARFGEDHPARLAIERHKENARERYEKHLEAIEKGK